MIEPKCVHCLWERIALEKGEIFEQIKPLSAPQKNTVVVHNPRLELGRAGNLGEIHQHYNSNILLSL